MQNVVRLFRTPLQSLVEIVRFASDEFFARLHRLHCGQVNERLNIPGFDQDNAV